MERSETFTVRLSWSNGLTPLQIADALLDFLCDCDAWWYDSVEAVDPPISTMLEQ